jgi:hypothetical protein
MVYTVAAPRLMRAGLYSSDATGAPLMLLAQSSAVPVPGVSAANVTLESAAVTWHLNAHERYWLCILGDGALGRQQVTLVGEGRSGTQTAATFAAGLDAMFTTAFTVNQNIFIAGVYTPNVANEARFGSTMMGTPASWQGMNVASFCRSGIPESSGMLERMEAMAFLSTAGPAALRFGLYSGDSGSPATLLAQSSGTVPLPPQQTAAQAAVYGLPVHWHLEAHRRYWLCVLAHGVTLNVGWTALSGEGVRDNNQPSGSSAAPAPDFAVTLTFSIYPTDAGYFISGIYTPDNVPAVGRALIIGGGVF